MNFKSQVTTKVLLDISVWQKQDFVLIEKNLRAFCLSVLTKLIVKNMNF